MTDLIERLRALSEAGCDCPSCEALRDAAAEIELRRQAYLTAYNEFDKKCRVVNQQALELTAYQGRVERLEAENFTLAAGQCNVEGGLIGDDHGHFDCSLKARVERLEGHGSADAYRIEELQVALRRIAKIADEPRKDWSRCVGDIARAALTPYATEEGR